VKRSGSIKTLASPDLMAESMQVYLLHWQHITANFCTGEWIFFKALHSEMVCYYEHYHHHHYHQTTTFYKHQVLKLA
jgi:hypothetical protein